MAVELVIKIPDEKYDGLIKRMQLDRNFRACKITPLPKGHGDLKDINEIWRLYDYNDIDYTMIDALNDAETVIEEDKS